MVVRRTRLHRREPNGFLNVSVDEAAWPDVRFELVAGAHSDTELIAGIEAMAIKDSVVSLACGCSTEEVDTPRSAQFPDYPSASMPPIPSDWIDKSWRNDAAPSFEVCTGPMGEPVEMWIDYLDPALREIHGAPRFGLYRRGTEDELEAIYTGDDFAEAMEHANREMLACGFAKALPQALAPSQWQKMRFASRTITPGACALRDYLDANMVMLAVWLTHRDQLIASGPITDIGDDLDHVNAAWSIARSHSSTPVTPTNSRSTPTTSIGNTVPLTPLMLITLWVLALMACGISSAPVLVNCQLQLTIYVFPARVFR